MHSPKTDFEKALRRDRRVRRRHPTKSPATRCSPPGTFPTRMQRFADILALPGGKPFTNLRCRPFCQISQSSREFKELRYTTLQSAIPPESEPRFVVSYLTQAKSHGHRLGLRRCRTGIRPLARRSRDFEARV